MHPVPRPAPPSYTPTDWIAVAAGGALGTGARAGLLWLWPVEGATLPWTTLALNVGGAFALGLLLGFVARGRARALWHSPFFGTGALGSFTTFSALAVDLATLATTRPGWGLIYAALSLTGGALAAAWGWGLGRGVPVAERA